MTGPRGATRSAGALELGDDECLFPPDMFDRARNPEGRIQCIRSDMRHHHDVETIRSAEGWSRDIAGPCIHRHREPVELVTGEQVAMICLHCLDRCG